MGAGKGIGMYAAAAEVGCIVGQVDCVWTWTGPVDIGFGCCMHRQEEKMVRPEREGEMERERGPRGKIYLCGRTPTIRTGTAPALEQVLRR